MVALSLAALMGCSGGEDEWTKNQPPTVPAEGIVTLDGKPVEGAQVVFAPASGSGHAATGMTDEEGKFALDAFPNKEGAVVGDYMVRISKTVQKGGELPDGSKAELLADDAEHAGGLAVSWVNVLPAAYASFATSGFTEQVPADGKTDYEFALVSNP